MSTRAVCIVPLLVAACTTATDDDSIDRRRRPDAAVLQIDAGAADGSISPGTLGSVSCYRENNASATCSAPKTCCFSNYSSAHNGSCGTSTCAWGTIQCDGPEDCGGGGGGHCCAHAIVDPEQGNQGYLLACQAQACGAPPLDHEMCHPGGTCSNGKTCVTAYGNANDLPRSLYVCR